MTTTREFRVTARRHPEGCDGCDGCVEAAITHASVTGSVAATYETAVEADVDGGGTVDVQHSATVKRLDQPVLLGELCDHLNRLRAQAGDDVRIEVSTPIPDSQQTYGGPVKVIFPVRELIANGSIMGTYVELVGRGDE